MKTEQEINEIFQSYQQVINKFKQNGKVYDGTDLAWVGRNQILDFANKPTNYGSATTTTGWCVSVSEAFLNYVGFQLLTESYGGRAKLVSIDIKEQHWGYVYNGHQNKWHTAILVQIDDFKFIIDLTCGQFGNKYVNKNIWYVDAWTRTFRSPFDSHTITDFYDNEIFILPVAKNHPNKSELIKLKYNLQNFSVLSDNERNKIVKFNEKFDEINRKLILGNYNKDDIQFLSDVIKLYQEKSTGKSLTSGWTALSFKNKQSATNWLNHNAELSLRGKDEKLINFDLKQNLLLYPSYEEAKESAGYLDSNNNKYLMIIKFINVFASRNVTVKPTFIVFVGTKLNIDIDNFVVSKIEQNDTTETTLLMTGYLGKIEPLTEGKKMRKLKHGAKKVGKFLNYISSD